MRCQLGEGEGWGEASGERKCIRSCMRGCEEIQLFTGMKCIKSKFEREVAAKVQEMKDVFVMLEGYFIWGPARKGGNWK